MSSFGGGSSSSSTTIARTIHLSSQTLPAAGAYTSQSLYSPLTGLGKYICFWVTYTRGTGGGFPRFRINWSNGTEAGSELVLDTTLTAVTPYAREKGYIWEIEGPVPADGNAITYLLIAENNIGATGVRLLASEAGVVGTPGTIAIAITGGN